MIIYRVTPFRGYPIIIKSILKSIKIESQELWSILKPKNDIDYNKILLKEIIPQNFKHNRFDGFLYGAFHSKHLNSRKNDFIFSIINHPVENIYEIYARINHLLHEYDNYYNNYLFDKNYIPNNWSCKSPFGEQSIKFIKENKILSEKEFIDSFLEKKEINFFYNSISYKIIDEIIFGYTQLNYIGTVSNLEKCYKKIQEIFNLNINFPKNIQVKSYIGNYYRRKDLESFFKDQIDYYHSLI